MNILLFSGGADSSLIFFNLLNKTEFRCLFVDYGQTSVKEERKAAIDLCSKFNIALEDIVINIPVMYNDFYVAGRNLALIGIAATRCSSGDSIYIGVNKSDEDAFPDCTDVFINYLNNSLKVGYDITLKTPLLASTKSEIIKKLALTGYTSYSYCYSPVEGSPCGVCLSCLTHLGAI